MSFSIIYKKIRCCGCPVFGGTGKIADKQVQVADITLLHQLTGWRPSVGLRDGLENLLLFEGLLK